jgi:hypothetical protein
MLTGAPLPLPPEFPLRQLIPMINGKRLVGAWVRDSGARHQLTITADGRCVALIIGEDLGQLLRCCSHIILRAGSGPVVTAAESVIQWRALQVVTASPYLPRPEQLRELFPDAEVQPAGFTVPTRNRSPEEVLSDCILHGIPVMESRVVYRH